MYDTTTAPTTSVPAQAVPAGNQTHALEDLRRRVVGRLHTPADETWDAVRTPWVVNIQQHPMAVLEVRDADDVIAAVRWAVDNGCQVTAQPTGHGGLTHARPDGAAAHPCTRRHRGRRAASYGHHRLRRQGRRAAAPPSRAPA